MKKNFLLFSKRFLQAVIVIYPNIESQKKIARNVEIIIYHNIIFSRIFLSGSFDRLL